MSTFVVTVNAESLIAALRGFPTRFLNRLEYVMRRLAIEVQAAVKGTKLSGQVLRVQTGTLRRSINQEVVRTASGIAAIVGTNVVYGPIHEYGGAVMVKQHLRMMREAFGRPVKNPREITVGAYTANYPERSFLRSTLKEFEPRIQSALKLAAVQEITRV